MDTDFHVAGDSNVRAEPQPVTVGERAVLGHQVILLPGTRVGADARVAPGSVVSGTVPDGVRVAGNPAITGEPGDVPSWPGRVTIGEVVARVFHLPGPASPALTPDDVTDWDSLGALRLMLALEDAFSIIIDEQQMAEVARVGDLERLVAAASS
jgi:acyl carrier protein